MMHPIEVAIGLIFIAIGLMGMYISLGEMRRQTADFRFVGVLVAIMSLGMVLIGVLRIVVA